MGLCKLDYTIVGYKDLVSMWYNEFLPEAAQDKAVYVKDAGIVYVDSIALESKKHDSIRFLANVIQGMVANNPDTIFIIVQEAKAVMNIRLKRFLQWFEPNGGFSVDTKSKVLHIANKRYVATSSDILLSQDKEIDEFLDQMFIVLSKLNLQNTRFCSSKSLPFDDLVESARSFFPKSALKVCDNYVGKYITVDSSSRIISKLSRQLKPEEELDSSASRFLMKEKELMVNSFQSLV